jgi:hypothetical protein
MVLRRTLFLVAAFTLPANAQQPAIQVRGRVLDAEGQPLATAGIVVGPATSITTAAALTKPQHRCAADGTFSFSLDLPTAFGEATMLLVAAPGKVALVVPQVETLCHDKLTADRAALDLGQIRLPGGFTLSGRVRDRAGKPIAGARIAAIDCLTTFGWLGPAFGSIAVSGTDGVFVLPGVFAQAMAVTVSADGCHDRYLPWLDLAHPLDVQLDASGHVEGAVVDAAGEPCEAQVFATYEFMGAVPQAVRTAGGRFRVGIKHPCRFFLQATALDGSRQVTSDLLSTPTTGLVLRLDTVTADQLSVRAVDATGKAITSFGATWSWTEDAGDHADDGMYAFRQTPAVDGIARIKPWSTGSSSFLHVTAVGHAPWHRPWPQPAAGKDAVAVELQPEARLRCRVVDAATRAPAAGMLVTCERVRQVDSTHASVPKVTGADGAVAFRGMAKGTYRLTARHPNGTMNATTRVVCKIVGDLPDVEIVLGTGAAVTGVVTRLSATAGWQVLLSPAEGTPTISASGIDDGPLSAWNTAGAQPLAANGAFRFANRANQLDRLFLVMPMPARQGAALRIPLDTVRTRDGDEVVDVDAKNHLPGAIAGKVKVVGADFPAGRLAMVTVAVGDAGPWLDPSAELQRRRWALVGGDGTFHIPAVAGKYELQGVDVATGVVLYTSPGDLEVAAGHTQQTDPTIEVATLTVRFTAEGRTRLGAERLEIRPHTGQQFDRHSYTLFGGGQFGSPGVPLAGAGNEVLCHVAPGTVHLRVGVGAVPQAGGSMSWGSEPAAEATVEAIAGEVVTVTMELPAPAEPPGK